jgi:hypothetical protein
MLPLEAGFAGAFQQKKECRSLGRTSATPDENDDAVMGLSLSQFDEVVTVASHHHAIVVMREPPDERISRLSRKDVT